MKFYALSFFPMMFLGACVITEEGHDDKKWDDVQLDCTGGNGAATGGNGSGADGNGSAAAGNGSAATGNAPGAGGNGWATGGAPGNTGGTGTIEPPPPPPPTCTDLDDEIACTDRADCTPIYAGTDCTCGPECTCIGGEPGCICESFGFLVCIETQAE